MRYQNFEVKFRKINFELHQSFKISRNTKKVVKALQISIKKGHISGLGECIPYKRYGEDREKIIHYLKKNKNINHISKIPYLSLQNAIDNSLLDIHLQDKKKEYKILLKNKKIYETLITVPILTIDKFKKTIKKYKNLKKIKIKLNQQNVFKYLDIIKNINPKISLVIDANEGWTLKFLYGNQNRLKKYNILFIEQPIKSSQDKFLKKINLPICADESFHLKNAKKLNKNYKWVNIKLDKFGTEKEVLRYIKIAKKKKLKILLGSMVSSSLSIAPALRYARYCDLLDLDGALFLKKDLKNGIKYKNNSLIYNPNFFFGNYKNRLV